jgi:hypothetical protein
VRREQSPDSQMRVGARRFRNERVNSLLNAVVHEPVGAVQALDQLEADRLPQVRVELFLRCSERERRDVAAVAEAGELLQRLPRHRRQAAQLPYHQVRDIGRVPLRTDAREVP